MIAESAGLFLDATREPNGDWLRLTKETQLGWAGQLPRVHGVVSALQLADVAARDASRGEAAVIVEQPGYSSLEGPAGLCQRASAAVGRGRCEGRL